MHRLRTSICTLCVLVIGGGPAAAQTTVVISGEDRHLYLNRQEGQVYRAARGPDVTGAGWSWTESKDYRWFLSKGLVPISDARFVELIETSQTAPLLVSKIRGRQVMAGVWAGASLATLVASTAAGAYLVSTGFKKVETEDEEGNLVSGSLSPALGYAGVGVVIGGLAASAALVVAMMRAYPEDPAGSGPKPFTYEEAQEALDGYNKWIDGKR